MHWYLEVLRKYAVFDGRARRQEYWMFVLISTLLPFVALMLASVLGMQMGNGATVLLAVYYVAVLLPSIAVWVRRLHDTGRSGWWVLASFVPLLGTIALLVFSLQDSETGTNQYGPNPKMARA
jgi:uncharacterized membrane protein YhaH (DUF805 family)